MAASTDEQGKAPPKLPLPDQAKIDAIPQAAIQAATAGLAEARGGTPVATKETLTASLAPGEQPKTQAQWLAQANARAQQTQATISPAPSPAPAQETPPATGKALSNTGSLSERLNQELSKPDHSGKVQKLQEGKPDVATRNPASVEPSKAAENPKDKEPDR